MINRKYNQLVSTNHNDTVLYDIACITVEGSNEVGIIMWNNHLWTVTRPVGQAIWNIDFIRSALSLFGETEEIHRVESTISTSAHSDVHYSQETDFSDFPPSYVERFARNKRHEQ